MKKRIITILIASMIAVLTVTPVLANDLGVEVQTSEVTIDGETATGTVTITCVAEADGGFVNSAWASSNAWYEVYLGGILQESGGNSASDVDGGWFWSPASADASQVFEWTYEMDAYGEYYFTQGGEADASYATLWPSESGNSEDASVADLTITRTPPPFTGDAPCWMPLSNQFHLWFGGLYSYSWIDGNTLPAIDQQSDGYWLGIPYNLRVVIAEGTQVDGGYCLQLCKKGGQFTFHSLENTPMSFSNPVIIYQMVDGEWEVIGEYLDF